MTTQAPITRTSLYGALSRKRVEIAILVCMLAVYFFSYVQRVAVPGTVFDEIQSEFTASASAVTALGAIFLYVYGGIQLFVGMMTDRFGAVRVLLLGGVLLGIGSIAFPLSHSLPVLYATRALVGLGTGLIFLSVVKGLDILFSPLYFPQLLAISQAVGSLGGLMGTFPFERAVAAWGWRETLLGAGVLTVLAVVLSGVLFGFTPYIRRYQSNTTPLAIADILRNRDSWPLFIVVPVNFGVYFLVLSAIGKKFLTDYCRLSSATAASFILLMMLVTITVGVLGALFIRVIGDRRKPLVVLSTGCIALGCIVLLLGLHFSLPAWWFLFGYLLLGFSSIGSALGNALMKELNPPEAIGTAIGALNSMCYIVVALLTTMAGAVMDRYWAGAATADGARLYPQEAYGTIFLICLGLAVLAFLLSLLLRETRGKSLFAR
jgi:MFS family permease